MKNTINSYFAVLIITIAGASAAWLIVHMANSVSLITTFSGSEATYAQLQQSILKP
ncbi:MAG: hypothetical protein WC814_02595 [Candidatus Paceibacterota bacterium]|jgi:hypothetical protein